MGSSVWTYLGKAFASGLGCEVCGRIGGGGEYAEKEETHQMEKCGSEANVDSGTLDTQSQKFGMDE